MEPPRLFGCGCAVYGTSAASPPAAFPPGATTGDEAAMVGWVCPGTGSGGGALSMRCHPLAAMGAVAGFVFGTAFVRWHAWRHKDDSRLQPTLVEIVSSTAILASTP